MCLPLHPLFLSHPPVVPLWFSSHLRTRYPPDALLILSLFAFHFTDILVGIWVCIWNIQYSSASPCPRLVQLVSRSPLLQTSIVLFDFGLQLTFGPQPNRSWFYRYPNSVDAQLCSSFGPYVRLVPVCSSPIRISLTWPTRYMFLLALLLLPPILSPLIPKAYLLAIPVPRRKQERLH